MSFKRNLLPENFFAGDVLTEHLVGIGVRLSGKMKRQANIEDTLVSASIEGLNKDGRVLSLLVDWIGIHAQRINADRLVQVIKKSASSQPPVFSAFWAAIAQWQGSDIRFAKLKKMAPKKRFDFLGDRTAFLINKNGEDDRFKETMMRVPAKVLRHRPDDILSPEELAKIHLSYRFRIIMGPSYRADMWALCYQEPGMTAAALAKACYGSYPTAFGVKKDFFLLKGRKGLVPSL